ALRSQPGWLQGMVAPTLMLWLYALALGIAFAIIPDGKMPWPADYLSSGALALILASWVVADAHKRQRKLSYDYDGFVFFAWPIVVPIYLFQTRGARAFLTLLCFAGIWLVAIIIPAVAAFILQQFLPE